MRRTRVVLGLLAGAAAGGCGLFAPSYPRWPADTVAPLIAVSSFENRSGYDGQWHLGDGMADQLVSELLHVPHVEVLERQHFENLEAEMRRQHGALFRPERKLASGRMKNAQYLVRGVVTDFSQESGGGLWFAMNWIAFLGRGYTARVALTLTLVDVENGQILGSVEAVGRAHAGEAYGEATYKSVHFGGDAFYRTPLGSATRDAIRDGVAEVLRTVPIDRRRLMIADVAGLRIVVSAGQDAGLRRGAVYAVLEPAAPITDPQTGDTIGYLPGRRVGAVRILQVERRMAFAERVNGSGFARGQWLQDADGAASGSP